jgi:3-hydroxyacyl-CoA dehydrogenase / 3-hydroxy-2-methylbutyryl-CoA dehydrogenase
VGGRTEVTTLDMQNKVAIVTGGASGLGEATVERVVKDGGKAVIFDLNAEKGEALATKLGGNAVFAKVDVGDEASAQAGIAKALAAFGAIHICVNCAGIPGRIGRVVSKQGPMALADFEKVMSFVSI